MAGDVDGEVLVRLPDAQRGAFKEPLGDVHTEVDAVLRTGGEPVIAIGDVVTATLVRDDYHPAVAVVDGRTERTAVEPEVRSAVGTIERSISVPNPPATITRELVVAIVTALGADGPVRIDVDGEEDLATLPAILAAPVGATVVYGQPGEGMVAVLVSEQSTSATRDLLRRMEGDHGTLEALAAAGDR